jgi:hypothetical protein
VLRVTLDTDCLIDLVDPESDGRFKAEMRRLGELAEQGKVELTYPATSLREFDRDLDPERRAARRAAARDAHPALAGVERPIGVSRLNVSKWDDASMVLGDDGDAQLDESVRDVMRPDPRPVPDDAIIERKLSDIDNLLAHARSGRDVFVTGNTDDFTPLRCKVLAERLGIIVQTPPEVLKLLDDPP